MSIYSFWALFLLETFFLHVIPVFLYAFSQALIITKVGTKDFLDYVTFCNTKFGINFLTTCIRYFVILLVKFENAFSLNEQISFLYVCPYQNQILSKTNVADDIVQCLLLMSICHVSEHIVRFTTEEKMWIDLEMRDPLEIPKSWENMACLLLLGNFRCLSYFDVKIKSV